MNRVCSYIAKGKLNRTCRVKLDRNYCQYDSGKWAIQISSVSIKTVEQVKLNCRLQILCNQIRGNYCIGRTNVNLPAPLCMFSCCDAETDIFFKQFPLNWFEVDDFPQGILELNVRDIDYPEENLPLENEYHIFFLLKRLD